MATTATREDHVRFWRFLARRLKEEGKILCALQESRAEMTETPLGAAVADIARAFEGGAEPEAAFARHPALFVPSVPAIVCAASGPDELGTAASAIADGIEDGSIAIPGAMVEGNEMARYWRALGRMTSCGVPLVEALQALEQEVQDPKLADATRTVRKRVLAGQSLCDAMREFPDFFPNEVRSALMFGDGERNLGGTAGRIAEAVASGDLSSLAPDLEEMSQAAQTQPARAFVNTLILCAFQEHADSVHLDPTGENHVRVRLRIDGVLRDFEPLRGVHSPRPPEVPHNEIINRIKVMAGIDTGESQVPQDGRIVLNISGKRVDAWTATIPTVHGERITLRLLERRQTYLRLDETGMQGDDLEKVRAFCGLRHGIVLLAGPWGSGKTTLLYAMLLEIDRDEQCVVSVEDPVEYYLEGVSQVDVDPRVGRSFATVIRSVLRQDPDVILIGEVRDSEVVNLAAQCALTGHLVFTTINAPTAPSAVRRLLDMGLAPFVLNASLAAVVSQRLVRKLCPDCKQPIDLLLHSIPPEASALIKGSDGVQFFRAVGCDKCSGTGYRRRMPLHEILVPNDRVKELVLAEASAREIREAAVAAGMRTLLACGIESAAKGETSIEEVLRVVGADPND